MRSRLDERATAEQVACLNGDERGEQQHESTERDRDLRRSEGEAARKEAVRWKHPAVVCRCDEIAQQTCCRPAERRREEQVRPHPRQVWHRRRDEVLEHGVRGDEQAAE